jgi:signal transduction histidine kinase
MHLKPVKRSRKAMKRTNLEGKAAQLSQAPEAARKGNGRVRVDPACDAPAFRCPACGAVVADALQAVQAQQRFQKRLFDRQDEFQQSLAASIHDSLAQHLTAALLHFEGALQSQPGSVNGTRDSFRAGLDLLRDSIHEAQRIAGRLRPLICDGDGITLGIEYLIHELWAQDGPEIAFQVKGEVGRLAPELESAVFWIVRELLTNTRCHSGSSKARLQVTRTKDQLWLGIEDWGAGFDLTEVNGRAFGLQEVYLRVALLGGEVIVDSAPGKGTRVVVSFPVADAPSVEAGAAARQVSA